MVIIIMVMMMMMIIMVMVIIIIMVLRWLCWRNTKLYMAGSDDDDGMMM